jgi:hypothetical protein
MGWRRGVSGAFFISLAVPLCACGGSSTSDGGGGKSGTTVQLPACLKTLLASCQLQGACTVADVIGDGTQLASCFASGVVAISSKGAECNNREEHVYASDAGLCYVRSSVAYAGHACEGPTTTWKDASGTLIATESTGSAGSLGVQSLQITCAATGERAVCEDPATCGWDALTGPECSVGKCP